MSDPARTLPRYLRPADLAQALGCNQTKVLAWIRSGELRAVDITLRKGKKPRWRIAQSDLDAFLLARSATPTPKPTRRQRRQRDSGIIEFF